MYQKMPAPGGQEPIKNEGHQVGANPNCLYPALVECDKPISIIMNNLTTKIWHKAAEKSLNENNLVTIGDLSRLSSVKAGMIKSLKPPNNVTTIREALRKFEKIWIKRNKTASSKTISVLQMSSKIRASKMDEASPVPDIYDPETLLEFSPLLFYEDRPKSERTLNKMVEVSPVPLPDIYDPEPFLGCPCGKKFLCDLPYKKHMATFHPLADIDSPKNDASNADEQSNTLTDEDTSESEDEANFHGFTDDMFPVESETTMIVPPVKVEVKIDSEISFKIPVTKITGLALSRPADKGMFLFIDIS